MHPLDEIFQEYVRMRDNGLDVKEALRALRHYIEPLGTDARDTLSQRLRAWESRPHNQEPAPEPVHTPRSNPIKPLRNEMEGSWIECPHCGKKNRAQDVFCYSCGQMFDDVRSRHSTRHFATVTGNLFNEEFYGEDSMLVLASQDGLVRFELRPQMRNRELVIGRSTDSDAMRPDIDLANANAAEYGVSRLHIALNYDAATNTIQIHDLGSANGTFVNGQRLHPTERRVLRHADELKLGRLALKVEYFHPGEEIR